MASGPSSSRTASSRPKKFANGCVFTTAAIRKNRSHRNLLEPALGLVVAGPQEPKEVTVAETKEFLKLLKSLPTKGEFFTDEAIKKAVPHTRVLLALDAKDLEGYDLYPFLALSRGLLDRKDQRDYGVLLKG